MATRKIEAKAREVLGGETALWQGNALFGFGTGEATSYLYAVLAPSGLHLFRKKMFTVAVEHMPAAEISAVDAVPAEMAQLPGNDLGAVSFTFRNFTFFLAPPVPGPAAARELAAAFRAVTSG